MDFAPIEGPIIPQACLEDDGRSAVTQAVEVQPPASDVYELLGATIDFE